MLKILNLDEVYLGLNICFMYVVIIEEFRGWPVIKSKVQGKSQMIHKRDTLVFLFIFWGFIFLI